MGKIPRRPIGVVLLSLVAAACNTDVGTEYDIPAAQRIAQAELETGPDGTPLIFAQVGMYYATAAPILREWEQRFVQRNIQAIAYTPEAGGWASHSFRNLDGESGKPSYFLSNSEGGLQALVQGLHRRILYARNGTEWVVKKSLPDKTGSDAEPNFSMWHGDPIVLAGDSAWEMPQELQARNSGDTRFGILRSNGSRFDLDTAFSYGATLLIPGKESNHLIVSYDPASDNPFQPGNGYRDTSGNADSTGSQELICYRWSLDPIHPDPRKQVLQLDHPAVYGILFSARGPGETRIYYQLGPDSLAELALRDDTLALLGYRVFPTPVDSSPGGVPYKRLPTGRPSVDPLGCIHFLLAANPIPSPSDTLPAFIHVSSCDAVADTVPVPRPTSGPFQLQFSELRYAADGSPMLSVTLAKLPPGNIYEPQESVLPSWLYLARRGPGNKWTWEKVDEYSGN